MDAEELAPQLRTLEAADLLYKVGGMRSAGIFVQARADPRRCLRHLAGGNAADSACQGRRNHRGELRQSTRGAYRPAGRPRVLCRAVGESRSRTSCAAVAAPCRRGANQDAVSIFERGLETLSHLSPSEAKTKAEIDFRLAVILALEPLGRHRRIADVLREARRFAEDSDDPRRLAAVNCHLASRFGDLAITTARWQPPKPPSAHCRRRRRPGRSCSRRSHHFGIVHHGDRRLRESVEMHRRCLALETPELDDKRAGWPSLPGVVLRTFLADALLELGEIEEAEAVAEEARRRADAADHAYSRVQINHVRSRIRMAQGRPAEAISLLQDAWQVSIDLELIQMYPILAATVGEAHLAAGDVTGRARHRLDARETRYSAWPNMLRLGLPVRGAGPRPAGGRSPWRSAGRGRAGAGARRSNAASGRSRPTPPNFWAT